MIILYSVLVMLAISLFLGIMIAVFAKVFEVKVDHRIELISEALPGYNCGACGFPGCDQYADAIIEKEGTGTNLCKPGGADTVKAINEILAQAEAEEAEKKAAIAD